MRCTRIPAEDYFPTLEKTGKIIIKALSFIEGLGY